MQVLRQLPCQLAPLSPTIMLKWSPGTVVQLDRLARLGCDQPRSSSLGGVRPESSASAALRLRHKELDRRRERAGLIALKHAHVRLAHVDQPADERLRRFGRHDAARCGPRPERPGTARRAASADNSVVIDPDVRRREQRLAKFTRSQRNRASSSTSTSSQIDGNGESNSANSATSSPARSSASASANANDAAGRPAGQIIRTSRLQLAQRGHVVGDHFVDREVRRQILIEAARPEGVHGLIVAQLLHQLGVTAHVAAQRGQQHQRRPAAARPQRQQRRPIPRRARAAAAAAASSASLAAATTSRAVSAASDAMLGPSISLAIGSVKSSRPSRLFFSSSASSESRPNVLSG